MSRHWVNMNYSKPSKANIHLTGAESVSQRAREIRKSWLCDHWAISCVLPNSMTSDKRPLHLFYLVITGWKMPDQCRDISLEAAVVALNPAGSVHIEHSQRLIFPRMVPFLAGQLHFKVPRELHSLFLFFSHMTGLWQEGLTPFALTWLSQNCIHQYFPAAPWAVT